MYACASLHIEMHTEPSQLWGMEVQEQGRITLIAFIVSVFVWVYMDLYKYRGYTLRPGAFQSFSTLGFEAGSEPLACQFG